ncbi:hypothetical protein DV736_g189, partial [Chaetothyriales sp. CBS 134916]
MVRLRLRLRFLLSWKFRPQHIDDCGPSYSFNPPTSLSHTSSTLLQAVISRPDSALRTPLKTRQTVFRRGQTTNANPTAEAPKQTLLQRLWTSEVGIKTVHFWAPVMKWGVVLVGASDFFRPADKLSITQNLALVATGAIWTRWCFVIRPQNILLAAVNFCLFIVGTVQVGRIFSYNIGLTGSTSAALKRMGRDIVGSTKQTDEKLKDDIEQAHV